MIDRITGNITRSLYRVSGFLFLAMSVVVMYGIIGGEFGLGSVGVEEIAVNTALVAIWLGVAYALREGRHVEIDAIRSRIPPRGSFSMRLFSYIVSVVMCGIMTWYGALYVAGAYRIGLVTEIFLVPRWLLQMTFPIGMFLMTIESGIRLYKLVKGQVKEEEFKGM